VTTDQRGPRALTPRTPGSVAAHLSQARIARGMTQKDVAEHLECHQSQVAGYESSSTPRIPRMDRLIQLADLYDVSLDWLLGRTAGGGPE
jgi:transcriptional regulator with XRE-family HTH domain